MMMGSPVIAVPAVRGAGARAASLPEADSLGRGCQYRFTADEKGYADRALASSQFIGSRAEVLQASDPGGCCVAPVAGS
jgi:hypothetical protein